MTTPFARGIGRKNCWMAIRMCLWPQELSYAAHLTNQSLKSLLVRVDQ